MSNTNRKMGTCRTYSSFKILQGRRCDKCINTARYRTPIRAKCHPEKPVYVAELCRTCWTEGRQRMAKCHPDQHEYAHTKCRKCYDEGRKALRQQRARKKLYGMSESEYAKLVEKQGGLCSICSDPASSIDHDHETEEVRGLLCKKCNSGLGMFKDSVGVLLNAVAYLSATKGKQC